MAYWRLTADQAAELRKRVEGRSVVDLGAGDLSLSHLCLTLKASQVRAIDKGPLPKSPGITALTGLFQELEPAPAEVGVLAWPWCSPGSEEGLLKHLSACQTVVYLGCNHDGTACGAPSIFRHLLGRQLLSYLPDRSNNMVVVGEPLSTSRWPTGEEAAGIDKMRHYSFQDTLPEEVCRTFEELPWH